MLYPKELILLGGRIGRNGVAYSFDLKFNHQVEILSKKTRLNKCMEKNKKTTHGGAREGAGRPKGSTNAITIAGLLGAIDNQAGRPYIELLAEDFAHARLNDRNLAQKYHHLIMNKVSATLSAVEVTDSAETVDAKKSAFAEAIAAIAGLKPAEEKSK